MSKRALIGVVGKGRGTLSAAAYAALIQLAWHLNHTSGRLDVSQERLAQETGWSLRTIKRAVTELQAARLIRVKRRKNATASYQLVTPGRPETGGQGGQLGSATQALPEAVRKCHTGTPEVPQWPTNQKRTEDGIKPPSSQVKTGDQKPASAEPPTTPRFSAGPTAPWGASRPAPVADPEAVERLRAYAARIVKRETGGNPT